MALIKCYAGVQRPWHLWAGEKQPEGLLNEKHFSSFQPRLLTVRREICIDPTALDVKPHNRVDSICQTLIGIQEKAKELC